MVNRQEQIVILRERIKTKRGKQLARWIKTRKALPFPKESEYLQRLATYRTRQQVQWQNFWPYKKAHIEWRSQLRQIFTSYRESKTKERGDNTTPTIWGSTTEGKLVEKMRKMLEQEELKGSRRGPSLRKGSFKEKTGDAGRYNPMGLRGYPLRRGHTMSFGRETESSDRSFTHNHLIIIAESRSINDTNKRH